MFKKGVVFTKEHREKLRAARIGMKFSEEHKRRISIAQKARPHTPPEPVRGERHWCWKGGISSDKVYRSWIKNKRNRLKSRALGGHTYEQWVELKDKYGNKCVSCFRSEDEMQLTEDHIIPLSRGGSDDIENIQPVCRSCNSKKGNKIINYLIVLT